VNLLAALAVVAALTSPAAATCEVTDAQLTWGFKESFRSYISSSIANGEWTVSDGATYDTPAFGFAGGTGAVPGTVAFPGSIEFTGHGGILDTTIANPQLVLDGSSTATLLLDVSGTTQEGQPVDERAVPFATVDVSTGLTDAPAELTAAGAAAFGTYPAGEELDPLTVTLPEGCSVGEPGNPGLVVGAVGIAAAALAIAWWVWQHRKKSRLIR